MMTQKADQESKKITCKMRALGIAYRILLVLGLVLFVATAVLAILTVRIAVCHLAIPAAIFLAGFVLARMEYNLFRNS